jgi:hypothetical protein
MTNCDCQPDEHCKICDPEFFEKLKQDFKLTCKRCSKEFTLRLLPKMIQAMEEIRRLGSEPTGTCPACKATNPDPFTKMIMDAGITTMTDMVKEDA